MRFDFTGVELFLAYWAGQVSAAQVLEHPAYRRVRLHAKLFSGGITPQELDDAVHGRPSPFYGLADLSERLEAVQRLLDILRREQNAWLETVEAALVRLFPGENLDIPVYPILGYDMGIGLDGAACLNCNHAAYLEQPEEFFFFIIHECVHVIYERSHPVRPLKGGDNPHRLALVFQPVAAERGLRGVRAAGPAPGAGCLAERDYQVLMDAFQLEAHRLGLWSALEALQVSEPLSQNQYLEICFGPQRLTYRMGCDLIRRIERAYGMDRVRQAFYLTGDAFVEQYGELLKEPSPLPPSLPQK